jgi:hypothetical protein
VLLRDTGHHRLQLPASPWARSRNECQARVPAMGLQVQEDASGGRSVHEGAALGGGKGQGLLSCQP